MSLLTTILHLLDEADCDGYELTPDNTEITVDGDAFWIEMEHEGLKVDEPRSAFGFPIVLKAGTGKVEIDGFHEHQTFYVPIDEWQVEAEPETLRQAAWRRYKTLPENMKDAKWPARINGAETLQQMTDVFDRVSKMWRVAQWRKRMGVAA